MSTKSSKVMITPGFEHLFSFADEAEEQEHKAQMISYRFLSELEKLCEERNIKKKDLAEMIGTSRSYITQLFTGVKQINTQFMARCEMTLDISVDITLKIDSACILRQLSEFWEESKPAKQRLQGRDMVWYCARQGGKRENKSTEEFIGKDVQITNLHREIA